MLAGMDPDVTHRFWSDIVERAGGPMTFRFFLQPIMALIAAWHDGTRDAKLGRKPYLWGLMRGDAKVTRKQSLAEGVRSVGRVLVLGVVMDIIYQWRVFGGFHYPVETIVIATLLAFVPYLVFRGPIARWQRHRMAKKGRAP